MDGRKCKHTNNAAVVINYINQNVGRISRKKLLAKQYLVSFTNS